MTGQKLLCCFSYLRGGELCGLCATVIAAYGEVAQREAREANWSVSDICEFDLRRVSVLRGGGDGTPLLFVWEGMITNEDPEEGEDGFKIWTGHWRRAKMSDMKKFFPGVLL